MVYLCGRPLRNRGTCTLGRETAIQPMVWGEDGWLRTREGQGTPELQADEPGLPEHRFEPAPMREDFDAPALPLEFQWLRTPISRRLVQPRRAPRPPAPVRPRKPGQPVRQSLVARRQQAHCYGAATLVDFEPEHFQQQAGLVCYYGGAKFHYLYISHDDDRGKHLRVMSSLPNHVQADSFTVPVPLPSGVPVELRVEVDEERLLFAYRFDGGRLALAAAAVRRQHPVRRGQRARPAEFHRAFVGMACQDMAGTMLHADFDYFAYRERPYAADAKRLPCPS
jgi:xylan 1,4-beta-xylosidase